MTAPAARPPSQSSPERNLLAKHLTGVRNHILGQLAGLDERDLHTSRLPSGWHLASLVKHLTIGDEHYWFGCVLGGDSFTDLPDNDWVIADGEDAEVIMSRYRSAIARSSEVFDATDLDAAPCQSDPKWDDWGITFPTARDVVLHVLVEMAIHAGHVDAVRELIDERQWLVVG